MLSVSLSRNMRKSLTDLIGSRFRNIQIVVCLPLSSQAGPVKKQSVEAQVNLPMIQKIEKICRVSNENFGVSVENVEVSGMVRVGVSGRTGSPRVLRLNLKRNSKILDVACGPGNVALILREEGYTHVDGLDPSSGLLAAGEQKGLFNKTFCCFVTPDSKTPIPDNAYDVLLCSAGMFPGSIVPQAFPELLRITRPGGIIAWNIADGYEGFNEFFKDYDKIYNQLIQDGSWVEVEPVQRMEEMLMGDAGFTYIMKKI
ncbi:uncharacterized protein LOC111701299 isoform X2 [Eurytemora carolleeae]|uniref:uncharacterized protein LOC111701299 isoform X2 n=1 Tax=Eurytemora carolleeae TaxID=1294199 RepID=UPI000C762BEF|nr:uncharacterized protein LOC111701299 isoform X2 [Eurytemora carolleeae]|eukprot:XP_023328285.1 uncharacterized protein LOC111701299 isoform X2 [Eurytemora affinis]